MLKGGAGSEPLPPDVEVETERAGAGTPPQQSRKRVLMWGVRGRPCGWKGMGSQGGGGATVLGDTGLSRLQSWGCYGAEGGSQGWEGHGIEGIAELEPWGWGI